MATVSEPLVTSVDTALPPEEIVIDPLAFTTVDMALPPEETNIDPPLFKVVDIALPLTVIKPLVTTVDTALP